MRDISGRRMADREQALLAAIVESSDAAIISLAADSRILTWNAAAEKLFGYTAEEAIGQLPAKVFARGGDTERAVADFLKSVETFRHGGVTARYFERTVQHKDGFFVDASFITSGIYDANAQLCGVSMIIRDISERKHKERDLARLAALVESSDDAISSVSTDFRITSWNRSAEKLFGLTAQEAIGQQLEMILAPDMREQVRRNMVEDLAALRERGNFVRRLETSVPRKDGTSAAVSLVVSGIFYRDGSVVGMSQSFRDITGLKRAEDELVTLASIVNTSGDAIISVSTDLKITSWNAAAEKVYGHTAQEAIGEGLELFVPPAELVQTIEVCRRVLETGQPASWEQHLQTADDTSVVSSVNIFATRDAIGRIVGISGIGRDITNLKQIEKEVREAHEYTRGLIESSVDAMVMVDGGMRIMDGNEQLARLLKLPRKVLLGSSFESYFTEPAAAHEALKKVFADGMVTNVDLVVKAADGKEIPVSFNASLFYRAGQVFGIFGVARDVTQQHATERTLRQEREYSRSLAQSSPDGLLVCDSNLLLTDLNEEAVTLTGYPREELIGIKVSSLFTQPALADQLLEQTSGQNRVHEVEMQLLTRTAQEIPVSLNTSAFTDSEGPGRRIVAAVRDISERKRVEKERSLLASIVESSGDAVYSETTVLIITSWNPAAEKLFGYSGAEVIGRSAALLAPLDCRAEIIQHAQNVQISGKPESFETRRLRKDGSVIDVAITQSPILDAIGTVTGASVTTHDIGERRRMEAELARTRDAALEVARLKSEFLANMSHEIRTPLNSVIGMTGLLLDTELDAEQREFANDAREAGQALLKLISDILDFSKISAGKLVFEEVDFDLNDVIVGAVELVVDQARRKGLELIVSVDPDVPRLLRGDPGRLRQILLNLISNAVKFTERGEVAVEVSKLGEKPQETVLRFEVRDTGIGIPTEKQHLLFQPFSQVDASTTRHYGGTGLGLSIVRELVEVMGGTIALSSTPGTGSIFWFTAKLAKQTDVSKPASERFASLTGTRILIVDDNADSREILDRQVSAWGMKSSTAASAEEGFAMVRGAAAAEPYQVALVDVMMPEIDGIELARRIKADPALAKTVVIFISSVGSRSEFSVRLVGMDIGGWLMKPVPESFLYNALVKALESSPGFFGDKPVAEKAITPKGKKYNLPGDRKLCVLLAEDNPINQKVARLQLGKLGLDVDTVGNGREAVEALSRRSYDVVLMDCQMPEMDGYEATREIRRREGAARHTTIVAMTANALQGDREKCLDAGMDAYISKPVTQDSLGDTLAKLFASPPSDAPGATPHPA